MKVPAYKGIDLFCGIGGFRLAMEDNKVQCVFSSDIDKFAQKTYYANFNEKPVGDIKKVDANDVTPESFLSNFRGSRQLGVVPHLRRPQVL